MQESHYSLLREDAVAPLRDVVSEVQVYHHLMEKDSDNGAFIYEKVAPLTIHFGASTNWLGLHHWPDVRQCRDCSSCYLLPQKSGKESQLGAVKTVAYGASCGTHSSERYVRIHLPCSHSRSTTSGRASGESSRDRHILWRR